MSDKILSVSIAAYNVEKTIATTLDSFTDEKVAPYLDVIIINDGSKDTTAIIVEEYLKKYPDVFRLITKENGGWGSTLNVGIKKAKGKYFKQLDGDDYFSKENLYEYLMFLKNCDADIVYSPYITFEDGTDAVISEVGSYRGDYRFLPLEKKIKLSECENFIPAMHCLTIKTNILKSNPIYITEHCFYTDVEYVLKSCNFCETICFVKWPIYYYRLARQGQSMSLSGVRSHYKDHVKMIKVLLKYMESYVSSPHMQQMFKLRLSQACDMQYIFFFALECTKEQKEELKEFDAFLKNNYKWFYDSVKGRQVNLLRKTNFVGYNLLARQKMNKDRRLKRNIFEGC